MTLPNATDDDTPGRTAYEAYLGNIKTSMGLDLPKWEDNDDAVKNGWESAALAVHHRWRSEDIA